MTHRMNIYMYTYFLDAKLTQDFQNLKYKADITISLTDKPIVRSVINKNYNGKYKTSEILRIEGFCMCFSLPQKTGGISSVRLVL